MTDITPTKSILINKINKNQERKEEFMSKIYSMIEPKKDMYVQWNGYEWKVNRHIIFDDGKTGYLLRRSWFTTHSNHEEYAVVHYEDIERREAFIRMAEEMLHYAAVERKVRQTAE